MIARFRNAETRWWRAQVGPFGVWLCASALGWNWAYLSLYWCERRPQVFSKLGEPQRGHVRWQRGFSLR